MRWDARSRRRGMVATKTLPMVDGERMTPEEFDRRIAFEDEGTRIELIDGRVRIVAPARGEHAEGHSELHGWVFTYSATRGGISVKLDGLLDLPTGERVAPDIFVFREGSVHQDADGRMRGVPELVMEVAVASVADDLGAKREVYERAGVPEYIVWAVREGRLLWFALNEGHYGLLSPGEDGVIESRVLPGLRLPVESLLSGDLRTLVRYGMGTEEA
jgi:Uma2 family endonuclease